MKNTCYKGCKNAASATAKIVYKFDDGMTFTNYYGCTGDAINALHENKNSEALKPFEYDIYIRNLNFVTGRYGNWVWVEKGNKNYITSYNW